MSLIMYSSEEFELGVINHIINHNDYYRANRYTITPDLFTRDLFVNIINYFAANIEHNNQISEMELHRDGLISESIMMYNDTTNKEADHTIDALVKLRGRRKLRDLAKAFATTDFNIADMDAEALKLANNINQIIKEISNTKLAVIDNLIFGDIVQKIFAEEITQLPLFLPDLDDKLKVQRNNMVVLAGNPGAGKTFLGLNIYQRSIEEGYNSIFFTTEMSGEQVVKRLCGIYANADYSKSNKVSHDELDKIYTGIAKSKHNMVEIPRLTLADVRKHIIALKERKGSVDYVFIDYLGRMDLPKIYKDKRDNIGYLAKEIKTLCKEFDCAIFLICQLSRENFKRNNKRPMLSDLADSADIEREADIAIFAYREAYFLEQKNEPVPEAIKRVIELNIAKNRHGETCSELAYFATSGRIASLALEAKSAYARELKST